MVGSAELEGKVEEVVVEEATSISLSESTMVGRSPRTDG